MATTQKERIDWASPPKFDLHQFTRKAKIVSAKTRIAWEDYGVGERGTRMRTISPGQNQNRRLPTPSWVMDTEQLKQVVLFYCEKRLYIRTSCQTVPDDWTIQQRLEHIQSAATNHGKAVAGIIDRCIDLHKEWTDENVLPLLLNKLRLIIQGYDSDVLTMQRGLVTTALGVAWYYYRLNYDSVEVAEALQLKSPGVRQILKRLNLAARQIKDNPTLIDRPQQPSNGPTREELACIEAGMTHAEYMYRREQIRAVIKDRPLNTRVEMARNSVSYNAIDKTELYKSVRTRRKATDVRWDDVSRRVELIRGEMVAAPVCDPMW